jgi:replicative DNA helicase
MEASRATVRRPVTEVLANLDDELRTGSGDELVHIPLAFQILDDILGGGIRPSDLMLVGGPPGVGKTIASLQWARSIASSGRHTVYVCYEHDENDLLLRLLSLELGEIPGVDPTEVEKLHLRLEAAASTEGRGLDDLFDDELLAERVRDRVSAYADHLHLVRASGAHTGLDELESLITELRSADPDGPHPVLFVDYLQKVAVRPEPPTEAEKVTRVAEGLKDLALRLQIAVICVVAADKEGLKVRRMRIHHFRGSSALLYESDVAIVINDKVNAVSKVHLAYDPLRAGTFKEWAVFSVEKNRGGPNLLDVEFRKDFAHYRFHPQGDMVSDRLVDERLEPEV